MSRERYRRMTRWAVISAVNGSILLLGLVTGFELARVSVVLLLLWVWAFGHYQADIALNPNLDADGRTRWRIGLGATPYAIVVYWFRQVRGRRDID